MSQLALILTRFKKLLRQTESIPKKAEILFKKKSNLSCPSPSTEGEPTQHFQSPKKYIIPGYEDPTRLISAIENPDDKLMAQLQLEAGLDFDWTQTIKLGQLNSVESTIRIKQRNKRNFRIKLQDKTFRMLTERMNESDELRIDGGAYCHSLKEAANATNQPYRGKRGLRANFAKNRIKLLESNGNSLDENVATLSLEMGSWKKTGAEKFLE